LSVEHPTQASDKHATEARLEHPTEAPVEQATETPVDQATETPVEQATDGPNDQPVRTSAEQPIRASAHSLTRGPPRGRYLLTLSIAALGIVFGDIGTSPLYAVRECLHGPHGVDPSRANVLGVLSLIVWSLVIVVSIKYLAYVLRADNRGEGGILALMALAATTTSRDTWIGKAVIALGLFGAALLYGDGMITPAISVLSAVEGLEIAAPGLTDFVVPITVIILVGLFWIQRRGTAGVGAMFGPVTFIWFLAIAALGIAQIVHHPDVLASLSPTYAIAFLKAGSFRAFLVLGAVFLVVTGGEALYADMGHFGARPIRLTWFAVALPALLLNYFGQGALLIAEPSAADQPFWRMVPGWALYPMLFLATFATIIASQALISGVFSLTRQATMLGFWPRQRVQHTSAREIGQIYLPGMNWLLMIATIGLVLGFGSSSRLAAAYGIAVTLTMVITTLLAFFVARRRWKWAVPAALGITIVFLIPDIAFLGANLIKIHDGGWFPLLIGAGLFMVMITWKRGREILGERFRERIVPLADFYELLHVERPARVPGTAVYLTSNAEGTPPALLQNFLLNRAIHQRVALVTITTEDVPFVEAEERAQREELEMGFVRIVARFGFMESPNVPKLLEAELPGYSLEHTTFFLGRETLIATERPGMAIWREKLFAFLSRNAQPATAFFGIPPDRVMEIGTQIEL
jgi:KUP system potassium uptake protein